MGSPWIWIDFENTPQVLFLSPLIAHLQAAGWELHITARRHAQTIDLAEARGFSVRPIGTGDFAGTSGRVLGTLARSVLLAGFVVSNGRPRLVVSCSRSASIAALGLRIAGVALLDYEHAEQRVLASGNQVIWMPDVLALTPLPRRTRRVARFYEGLKENLYLDAWRGDRIGTRASLGVAAGETLVVARPPADMAHYADRGAVSLWIEVVAALAGRQGTRVMVVSRSTSQRERLARAVGPRGSRMEFLDRLVFGPSLIEAADLVVGGGGTMNREAAVLGVPVWSCFTGKAPHIDECLAAEGRLRWVRSGDELAGALSAQLPQALNRRGPYPGGLRTIVSDLDVRLQTPREA